MSVPPVEAVPPRDREPVRPRRTALWAAGLLLLAAAALATVATSIGSGGRVLPNTSVAGVPLGRLDAARAVAALEAALDDGRLPPPPAALVVTGPDGVVALPTEALGLRYDLAASADRARARGRTGRPGDVTERLRSLRRTVDLAPVLTAEATAVRGAVDELALRLDRPPSIGELRVDPVTLVVEASPPRTGIAVDRERSEARLMAALSQGSRRSVALAAAVAPAPAPRAAIEDVATRLRTALTGDHVLVRDGTSVTVTPGELAAAASIVADVGADGRPVPALRLDPVVLARGVGPRIVAGFARDPVDAALILPPAVATFSAMGSTSFTPLPATVRLDRGRSQLRFSMDLTARQLEAMIADGRRAATADLVETPADVPPEAFTRHLLPSHVVGTFTTFHPAGAPRTVNIRRLADTIDGTLVAPGEEFSVNAASGERRCGDGYVLAGTIVRGELVDTCGGGVSQLGTTLYNAAFFAGVPTTAWQPHSFFISRYPMGREATLSYPDLDVRFVNDTSGWIVIRTAHTPTSITVTLLGVPAWSEVRAVHSEVRDPRPHATELRAAPDLAPGRQRVVQSGGDGFTVDVSRVRIPIGGGELVVERTRTVYRPQTRIVEVGTLPVEAPDPAD